MNGSRSTPPRHSDRTSLDALNRTIEGLEARIEGLMGTSGRDARQRQEPDRGTAPAPQNPGRAERDFRIDPLAEIRERQRALETGRQVPPPYRQEHTQRVTRPESRYDMPRGAHHSRDAYRAAAYAEEAASRAPAAPVAAPRPQTDTSMRDIAQALVSLRQELKQDISDGLAKEMAGLRGEIRNIRAMAEDRHFAEDVREDLARLAQGIDRLGHQDTPEAYSLRTEFDELRSLLDNLAREDSVQRMETRWNGVEDRLRGIDTGALQDELVSLAYRLDDIKTQLGHMSSSPAIRALEDKLLAVATAMEQLGTRMRPNDDAIVEQFATLDQRLDEISRAIAAGSRSASAAADNGLLQRLEGRIGSIAEQIDTMSRIAAERHEPTEGLSARIEALTDRIEEIANERAAARLEERLDQLSYMLEQAQLPAMQPELTGYLSDISRKIDALDHGTVNDALAERLDYLARRIDEMDQNSQMPQPVAAFDEEPFLRLEGRLSDIAARLEETTAAPAGDHISLRNLEEQIAHLSVLISKPREQTGGLPSEFENRMAALEEYMTTNDEYIIEAARQAAEAVVEAYSRNGAMGNSGGSQDIAALSALAEDLRHLEDLSRDSEERTHKTFEALHGTLVQIAERLDSMDSRIGTAEPRYHSPVEQTDLYGLKESVVSVHRVPEQASVSESRQFDEAALFATASYEYQIAEQQTEAHGEAVWPEHGTAAMEEEAPEPVAHAATPDAEEPAAPKAGLLAGISRRLRPGSKEQAAKPERTLIDPAPSIDPVDLLPQDPQTEEDFELLEPGSGAPDVKKILERVRASQQAAREGKSIPPTDAERADYIAAARRAAQVAAQEADPAVSSSKLARQAAAKSGASAFSRHRRPIMMAIGAVLLAMMAMPLVNTLTRGEKAPAVVEPAAIEMQAEGAAPADDLMAETPSSAVTGETTAATTNDDASEAPADANSIAPADLPETPAATDEQGSLSTPAAPEAAPAFAEATSEPAAEDIAIAVPEAIEPKSLADAAAAGDPLALFEIGSRYTEGRGVATDLSEAAHWYKLAADRGLAPAQYRLASLFEKGNGVERNVEAAQRYYRQAAELGNASAMHNLAVLYASGLDSPNFEEAVTWFHQASEFGVSDSQFNLAILYARGNGVAQDLEESYKWFAIAANDGDNDAAQKRDEVANAMRPEQLESARAKVELWKPKLLDEKANSVDLPDEWVGKGTRTATVDMTKAIRNIQAILNNNGFDAGTPDGQMGKRTIAAIKAFQQSIGQEPTGKITDDLVKELLARNT